MRASSLAMTQSKSATLLESTTASECVVLPRVLFDKDRKDGLNPENTQCSRLTTIADETWLFWAVHLSLSLLSVVSRTYKSP